jgi:hypothetical protein
LIVGSRAETPLVENAAAASTNGPTTGSGAASTCGSACNPKTSDTMNMASKTKPVQSARQPCVPSARAVAEPAEARPAMAANMSRTLSQKITRQPVTWVSAPPSSGPMLKPSIRNPVQAAGDQRSALRRRAGVDRSQSAGHRERCREAL